MFTGNKKLDPDLLEVVTPILFSLTSSEVQKDLDSAFRISEEDVRQFIGIAYFSYLMSLIQLPRVTNNWDPILGTLLIQETMTLNKLEKIHKLCISTTIAKIFLGAIPIMTGYTKYVQ